MLDNPMFVQTLYHPTKVPIKYTGDKAGEDGLHDGHLPTPDPAIQLGYRLMVDKPGNPLLLHFHGNAEVASDVIHRKSLASACGVNILAVDYRGYGWSTGSPQISSLVQDAHAIAAALPDLIAKHNLQPTQLWLMGRSLGSVWAAELACVSTLQPPVAGVIIESGFASLKELPIAAPMLQMLGPAAAQLPEPYANATKLGGCALPLLVVHGDNDTIVPHWHGEQILEKSGSSAKLLVTIKGGGHNDLTSVDGDNYFAAVSTFITSNGNKEQVTQALPQAQKCCQLM